MSPTDTHDRQGWCGARGCRTLFTWRGMPVRQRALCPVCRAPLAPKPANIKGRYDVLDRTPLELHVPELVLRVVDD